MRGTTASRRAISRSRSRLRLCRSDRSNTTNTVAAKSAAIDDTNLPDRPEMRQVEPLDPRRDNPHVEQRQQDGQERDEESDAGQDPWHRVVQISIHERFDHRGFAERRLGRIGGEV